MTGFLLIILVILLIVPSSYKKKEPTLCKPHRWVKRDTGFDDGSYYLECETCNKWPGDLDDI